MAVHRYALCAVLLGALLGAGCTGPGAPSLEEMQAEAASLAPPDLVVAHREDAVALAAAAVPDAGGMPDPEELRAFVEKTQREVELALQDRAHVAVFRDPASQALREVARDPVQLMAALAAGVSPEQIDAYTIERNPRIRGAWQKLQAAVQRYPQIVHVETLLSQYQGFVADLQLQAGAPLHRRPVTLQTPAPGVGALKADLVARDVELARLEFEKTVRDQIVAAETALFELWYLGRAVIVQGEILESLRQLEETLSSRLETARSDKSQLLRVQVEISSLDNDLVTLEDRRRSVVAQLAALLDLEEIVSVGVPVLPAEAPVISAARDSLVSRAGESRVEVLMASERIRRIDTAIELAEKGSQPDWTLGLGYFRGIRPVDRPSQATGVLPQGFGKGPRGARNFWFGQSESFLREVRTTRSAMIAALDAERRSAEYLASKEWFALDEARRKLSLYAGVLVAQARQAYEDTLIAYQSDRATFPDVFDALRQWLRFDLECSRARRDYQVAVVRLEAAVGGAW